MGEAFTALASLSDDSLAALANRGLVKRGAKELADGGGPTLEHRDDGATVATFADGTTVTLGPGDTLGTATCTCGSTAICRHRVMVALSARAEPDDLDRWSPAEFTDEQVAAHVGDRAMQTARRLARAGFRARVRRPTAADPVPTVELPSCTVRFLVPHDLAYVHVDAATGSRADAVALAIWAARHADEVDAAADEVDVGVGGDASGPASSHGDRWSSVLAVLTDILGDGVVNTGPHLMPDALRARGELDRANFRWPVDALDELTDQLEAYRARQAHYRAERSAELIAELVARHRAGTADGPPTGSLRSTVLGTEEAAETPLKLVRLTGLGAQVTSDDGLTVEVYLAHVEAGVVLAVRRRVATSDDEDPPTGPELARRSTGGARFGALAAGNVVTESAVRAANRTVRIAANRVARTTVSESAGDWSHLPRSLVIDDLGAEYERLADLRPRVVRARLAAESIRVVEVAGVHGLRYRPGDQQVDAEIAATLGVCTLECRHLVAAPGAVDAVIGALDGSFGEVRYIAGHLERHGGRLLLRPTAIAVGTRVVVPAFETPAGRSVGRPDGAALPVPPAPEGRAAAAVTEAIACSADVVHRGARHLTPSWTTRVERAASGLRAVGFDSAAGALATLSALPRAADERTALDQWADVHLRLLVTSERL